MEQPRNLLVVDDDPRICRLLKRYLEKEGYDVHTASSVEAMRQNLSEIKVDLVLLDDQLAGVDTSVLKKEVRSVWNLPVLMVTGAKDFPDGPGDSAHGAHAYVAKPFDERELLDRVHDALQCAPQNNSRLDV